MKTLTVAGAQMAVRDDDIRSNTATILRFIELAASKEADILLTPEGSLSGYTHEFDQQALEGPLAQVIQRATTLGIGLALGTCFYEPDGQCFNQLRFYDRRGAFLGSHAKILRCGVPTPPSHGEFEWYATHELRTFVFEDFTVAGLICNDLWANPAATVEPDPNLVLRCAELGAQIIFHAVNGARAPGEQSNLVRQFHEANLRMRAQAASIHIATVDNASPVTLPSSSPGGVIGPDGSWVIQTVREGEDMFIKQLAVPASRFLVANVVE